MANLYPATPYVLNNSNSLLSGTKTGKKSFFSPDSSIQLSNVKKKYKPQTGDKLYFTKDCTVPRIKAREYCSKERVSITIKQERATHVIVPSTVNGAWNYHYKVFSPGSILRDNKGVLTNKFQQELMAMDPGEKIVCNINWNVQRTFNLQSYSTDYMYGDNYEVLSQASNLVSEEALISNINASRDALTFGDYKQLVRMHDSGDRGTIQLGLEMITNCNYDKSLVFLLPLFKLYQHRLSMTVNQNALRTYCNQFDYSNPPDLLKVLESRKELNQVTFQHIMEFVTEYTNQKLDISPFHILIAPPDGIYDGLEEAEEVNIDEVSLIFI